MARFRPHDPAYLHSVRNLTVGPNRAPMLLSPSFDRILITSTLGCPGSRRYRLLTSLFPICGSILCDVFRITLTPRAHVLKSFVLRHFGSIYHKCSILGI
jgi:hypothetical protein